MNYDWKIKYLYKHNLMELLQYYMKMNKDEFKQFLDIKSSKFKNPNLLPNIDKAIERTKQAIQNKEKILISGDYDCDRVTSTTIMMIALSTLTPYVGYRIPLRSEGYGLSKKIVDEAVENGIKLIITVDNGIAANEAINYAKEKGIDVIVTDHHPVSDRGIPTDISVDPHVNQDYEFKSICGCMVAYKFLRMLIPDLHKQSIHNEIVVLTMFGTIADSMLLKDENRKFVSKALEILNKKQHISYGIDALINNSGLNRGTITSTNLAFSITPAINAIGRLQDASLGVELFLSDDEVKADTLAKKIFDLNNKRKALQQDAVDNIHIDDTQPFIVEVLNNVPNGLLGGIAGKVADEYQRPCFLLHENKQTVSGSGRSFAGYDIKQNITNNKDIVNQNSGGHSFACGISLPKENLTEFKKRCCANYNQWLKENKTEDTTPVKEFLCELHFDDINDNIMKMISQLEPFGTGNKAPMFCAKHVKVLDSKVLGAKKNAVKLNMYQNDNCFDGIAFFGIKDKYVDELQSPDYIDIGFVLNYNYWNGNRKIQLQIEDVRLSDK